MINWLKQLFHFHNLEQIDKIVHREWLLIQDEEDFTQYVSQCTICGKIINKKVKGANIL